MTMMRRMIEWEGWMGYEIFGRRDDWIVMRLDVLYGSRRLLDSAWRWCLVGSRDTLECQFSYVCAHSPYCAHCADCRLFAAPLIVFVTDPFRLCRSEYVHSLFLGPHLSLYFHYGEDISSLFAPVVASAGPQHFQD